MPKKLTNYFVEDQLKNSDYIMISNYIDSKTKINYICPNGHRHHITWNNWNKGARCPSCAGNAKPTIKFVKVEFSKEGYILLSVEYINANSALYYRCPAGHKHSTTWHRWTSGRRCPSCANNIKLTFKFIKSSFIKKGCILLSTNYENAHSKLDYVCPNGHKHSLSWNNWLKGVGCPKCSNNGTSNFEKEVKEFVQNLGYNVLENDRSTILNPKTNRYLELDILFPCKTKAIECNGVYWHSLPEAKIKDEIKNKRCKKLGIKLLTITDDMWYNAREECEKIIKKFLNS